MIGEKFQLSAIDDDTMSAKFLTPPRKLFVDHRIYAVAVAANGPHGCTVRLIVSEQVYPYNYNDNALLVRLMNQGAAEKFFRALQNEIGRG